MAQEIADSTLLDTWASSGLIVEPDISKIIEGWQLGEQPPHEYMNWLQNTFGSKLNHILKNGVAGWNNETEYLAGSSVQHNGNVWLCKTTNTNSEPADVNANWKRIITVESLTTVLNGYVKNTGDEIIDGVKTFSSSPTVPTPTTGTQAANKAYVDTKQSKSELAYNVGTSSYIPNTLSSGAIIERGSNLNGEYIKYADGTLICRHSVGLAAMTAPYGSGLYQSTNDLVWTYPSVFSSIPNVFGTTNNRGCSIVNVDDSNLTQLIYRGLTYASGTVGSARLTAIGRWK